MSASELEAQVAVVKAEIKKAKRQIRHLESDCAEKWEFFVKTRDTAHQARENVLSLEKKVRELEKAVVAAPFNQDIEKLLQDKRFRFTLLGKDGHKDDAYLMELEGRHFALLVGFHQNQDADGNVLPEYPNVKFRAVCDDGCTRHLFSLIDSLAGQRGLCRNGYSCVLVKMLCPNPRPDEIIAQLKVYFRNPTPDILTRFLDE